MSRSSSHDLRLGHEDGARTRLGQGREPRAGERGERGKGERFDQDGLKNLQLPEVMLTKLISEEELPPLKNDLGLEANRAASRFRGELANVAKVGGTREAVTGISTPNFRYIAEQEWSRG